MKAEWTYSIYDNDGCSIHFSVDSENYSEKMCLVEAKNTTVKNFGGIYDRRKLMCELQRVIMLLEG